MAALWISAILFLLVGSSSADFQPEVCSIFKKSCGFIPPPIPTNFELKGEYVDHLKKFVRYEELYFDYTNSRAKYMYLESSIQHHFLFDYETLQIVEWDVLHPGVSIKRDPLSHTCTAVNMEDAAERNLFGYQDWTAQKPKMFNSNQVLRFGGQYLYMANGTERLSDRGLLVNKFIGCLYDSSIDATLSNSYYFSAEKVEPAGATTTQEVIGAEDGYLSVPVKLQITGSAPNETGDYIQFNETVHISWFKGEPEFQVGTFQIPPWIYCKNYRGRKDMPKFPVAFSTRLAVTQFQVGILGDMEATESESFEEIYYYAEKNLARRDFTPNPFLDTDIYNKFLSYTPVRTIYDFNQGLRYTINKPSGRCYIGAIQDNEYFDTEKSLLYRMLAPPEEIFLMQMDDMEYKGKAFTRDIECDVWTGRHFHEKFNATFVKETYISTNGWHEEAEEMIEYGVPVKHMVIKQELDGDLTEGVIAYNFLKFKAKPPFLVNFDIQNCVELIDHKRFAFKLSVSDDVRTLLYEYRFQFLETAQYYIADMAQVMTPLRIQRIHIRPQSLNSPTLFLVFVLLDKADLSRSPVLVGQKGASLQDAIVNLQKVVDGGRFAIQFYPPKAETATLVAVRPGDLYQVKAGGNLTLAPLGKLEDTKEFRKEDNPEKPKEIIRKANQDRVPSVLQHADDTVDAVDERGMTSSHLTLLAFAMLFIGLGIGIAVMYLYVRIYSERQLEDRINLTTQKSKLEAKLENAIESPADG